MFKENKAYWNIHVFEKDNFIGEIQLPAASSIDYRIHHTYAEQHQSSIGILAICYKGNSFHAITKLYKIIEGKIVGRPDEINLGYDPSVYLYSSLTKSEVSASNEILNTFSMFVILKESKLNKLLLGQITFNDKGLLRSNFNRSAISFVNNFAAQFYKNKFYVMVTKSGNLRKNPLSIYVSPVLQVDSFEPIVDYTEYQLEPKFEADYEPNLKRIVLEVTKDKITFIANTLGVDILLVEFKHELSKGVVWLKSSNVEIFSKLPDTFVNRLDFDEKYLYAVGTCKNGMKKHYTMVYRRD